MPDSEKREIIIREFERFVQEYSVEYTDYNEEVLQGVLALLKEQEPVEPHIGRAVEYDGHDSWWYKCGIIECGRPIDFEDKYCRHCGRAVKWE